MNTQVDSCTLTCLDNLVVELLLDLGNDLLDTCRVDTTIADELMESQAADLTTNRIETRNNDSLRCIVDNDLNTSSSLERTDVASPHRYRYGTR